MNGRRLGFGVASLAATLSVPSLAWAAEYAIDLETGPEPAPEFVCLLVGGPEPAQRASFEGDTQAAKRELEHEGACGASHPACAATVPEAQDGRHFLCARNAPWSSHNGRVVVLEVDAGVRPMEQLSVAGSAVHLSFGGAEGDANAKMTVRVAGGDYRPGAFESPIGRRVGLRLDARCFERTISWPAASGSVTVELGTGEQKVTCSVPPSPSVSITVPPGVQSVRATLGGLVQEAAWSSPRPPDSIKLEPSSLSFEWHAPCEYPDKVCPGASIPEAGLTCSGQAMAATQDAEGAKLSCAYRCERSSMPSGDASWPLDVVFRGSEAAETWVAKLRTAGEELHGYVPEARRSFPVRFAWDDTSEALLTRAGDRIRFVEVTTPKGVVHRIEPRKGLRVSIPGARCGDTFDSRVVGDRAYGNATARIEEGWLVIPNVEESAHVLQVGGMLGGGFILPASRFGGPGPDGLESRVYGTAQIAFRLQPEPHVEGSVFEPRAYELHLSYVIAQQPYFPVHAPDTEVDEDADYLPFNRWELEVMPMWQLGQRTQLGVGAGIGLGFPVRTVDEPAVGKSRLFFVPLSTVGRIQVSQAFSIEGSFRLIGPEKVYRYEPSPFFAGTPTRSEETLWSGMLGLVGVRLWL